MADDSWPRSRGTRAEGDRGPRTLTASEAAALIGVSVATIRGWADQGSLPSHRTVGNHRRFELEELRAWLADRGAAPPTATRLRPPPQDIPPCPLLARELNARTEAVVARVVAGFDPAVPTPLAAQSEPAMRRLTVRFLRILASGLDSGRPAAQAGRAELAGLRGGLQGRAGARVLLDHTRIAVAVVLEAERAREEAVPLEAAAIPALYAVIDHAQAAIASGFEQAQGMREDAAHEDD
jgi:excisionase family DNA binding protein